MPVFLDDPSQLSISRLKSDLIAHNVRLPPAKSRKEVYVELYLRHVDQKKAVDFSCDEEDEVEDVAVSWTNFVVMSSRFFPRTKLSWDEAFKDVDFDNDELCAS